MRKYNISFSTTDPDQQQHNPYEQRIQVYKEGTYTNPDQTGAPIFVWPFVILIWFVISNFLDKLSDGYCSTNKIAFGATPDISHILHYIYWDCFYYYNTE